jgi:hypothetical protein
MNSLRQWRREPLMHFLVLGGALFAFYRWQNPPGSTTGPAPQEIVVTRGRIANLAESFARVWQRPPTQAELGGLVEDYIREEVLYREALALGLDRDDTILRRRLRQKMEFISEDVAAQAEPTDDELQQYFAEHADAYRVDPRLSFRHVYLSTDRRGDRVRDEAGILLEELRSAGTNVDISELGDPLMLEPRFVDIPLRDVAGLFGAEFSDGLEAVPAGEWTGPVQSGYGLHLVFVDERTPGRLPELADVRDAVLRDWLAEQRREANDALYQALREQYTITIEQPEPVERPADGGDS